MGGDITAGVISSGMYATDKLTLFIDIGTNGEMVLGNKDWLHLAAPARPGPPSRAAACGHGMRATAGRHRGRVHRRRHVGAHVPHGRRRARRRHLRQRPHRPARRALRHRPRRQVGAPRPRGPDRPRARATTACPSTSSCWAGEGGAEHDIVLTESDITNLHPRQGRHLRGLRGALQQRRRRPRRRRADPHRRRLRPVHQRREGDPHRPAARPARRSASTSSATPARRAPTRPCCASTSATTSSTSRPR